MVDVTTREGATFFMELLSKAYPEKLEDLKSVLQWDGKPEKFMALWKQTVAADRDEQGWLFGVKNELQKGSVNANKEIPSTDELNAAQLRRLEIIYVNGGDSSEAASALQDDTRRYLEKVLQSEEVAPPVPSSMDEDMTIDPVPEAVQSLPSPAMLRSLECKRFATDGPKALSAAWNFECERVEGLVRENASKYFGGDAPVASVGELCPGESIIVGRILNENPEQSLTPHTLLLEGSAKFSNNQIVSLRFDRMQQDASYYLYPGKIVVCLGVSSASEENSSMNDFHVYDIKYGVAPLIQPPKAIKPMRPDAAVDLCILGGPFVPSSSLRFDLSRIRKSCAKIRDIGPSAAVIMGPFLSYQHPLCGTTPGQAAPLWGVGLAGPATPTVSYVELYKRILDLFVTELAQKGVKTIIMPHGHDILCPGPVPQRPLNKCIDLSCMDMDSRNLTFESSPCHLNVNGLSVMVVGNDLMKDIAPINVKGMAISNSKRKMAQLHSEIVEQMTLIGGTMLSSCNILADEATIESARIASGVVDDPDVLDPHMIVHTVLKNNRPKIFKAMPKDRAIGSAHESLVHIRVLPADEQTPNFFCNEFKTPGRVRITTYSSESK